MATVELAVLGGGEASGQLINDAAALNQLSLDALQHLLVSVADFVRSEDADALKEGMVRCSGEKGGNWGSPIDRSVYQMATVELAVLGGGEASGQLINDAAALNQLSLDALQHLLVSVADFVRSEDADALKEGMVRCSGEKGVALPIIRQSARGLVSLASALASSSVSSSVFDSDLRKLGVESGELRGAVISALLPNAASASAAAQPTATPSSSTPTATAAPPVRRGVGMTGGEGGADIDVFSANQLLDMSWRFGLTAGNNSIKQVGDSFLQLALQLDQGGSQRRTVHVELTLPQFYAFLAELERASKAIELFSCEKEAKMITQ
eukprot:TRINITY_DN260_c0_g1_i2.p1 TRINITY_DN260_c0_g1~~TRINITY_DN260_c0_g1_i2.p1  ORF type:complete len:344 (+),score=69.83 TRINITY_DN260_c0_g1_i2:62-1033(+)